MKSIILKNDEIGLLPIKDLNSNIKNDLLSMINVDLKNDNELNNIINSYKITNDFLLYIFIEQCNNIDVKNYLINRFPNDKLLSDVLSIKKIYYGNNLLNVIRKYNLLIQKLSEGILQIKYDIDIKKEISGYDDNYSEYEYYENEYIRIMNLNNNINEINEFISSPSLYNKEFNDFDNGLDRYIINSLNNNIKVDSYDLFLMFNEVVSSIDWINVPEDMKCKVIEQISLFSSKINVLCDMHQFTIFSDSKSKMLSDKYKKN